MRRGAATPSRLALVVAPVCIGGLAIALAAAVALGRGPHDAGLVAGLAVLLAASAVAERFPVPVDRLDITGVSLAFVFGVAGVVLFGWPGTILVVAGIPGIVQLLEGRPPLRVAYNASMHALAIGIGAVAISAVDRSSALGLLAAVMLCGLVQHAVNMVLVSAVVAASSGGSLGRLLWANYRSSAGPFALMTSAALMLVVLWERSPILSATLLGPLLAIALYQRSAIATLRAIRVSLTDAVTGLGNHRRFHERLQRELERCEEEGVALSLCIIDVDDFKLVNDRLGHQVGDRVLAQVASRLRQGGEAFRLGGDEFALLLPRQDDAAALATAESVVARISSLVLERGAHVTASAGVATLGSGEPGRDDLVRRADAALYSAKARGKNRARSARSEGDGEGADEDSAAEAEPSVAVCV